MIDEKMNNIEKEEIMILDSIEIKNKLLKIKNDNERIKFLLWIIENLIDLNKNIYMNKYTLINWSSIIDEFYKDKNPMRRYKMIHEIISGKYLCRDTSCQIHIPLIDVGKTLETMMYYSLDDAKSKYGEKSQDYMKFKRKFESVNLELTKAFSDVKVLFDSQNTERYGIERSHQRSLEKIVVMGKAGVHYTAKVGTDVDKSVQLDETILMPGDKEIISGNKFFKDLEEQKVVRK